MGTALKPLILKIGSDIKGLEQGLDQATTKTKGFGKMIAGVAIGAALVKIGKDSIGMAIDFRKSMGAIETLIPGNTARVNQLSESVEDLAITTGKGAEDIAGGLFEVISAFGDSADSAEILEIAVKAATAGLATTESSVKLLSGVMKGYNDVSAEGAQKTTDLAFLTNKLGQTTFPELASAMGNVIPLASTLGVAQEELFAVMATGTGVTGDTNAVTTQLKATMSNLLKPSEKLQQIYKKLEVSGAEQLITQHGLVGALELLREETGGSTAEFGKLFESTEALNLVFALTGSQADTFQDKFAQMQNSAGAGQEAFDAFTKGVNKTGHEMLVAQQKIAKLQREIGEALLPAVGDVLGQLDPLINLIKGPAIGAFQKLGEALSVVTGLADVFGKALADIGENIPIIGEAVDALGKSTEDLADIFGDALAEVWDGTTVKLEILHRQYKQFIEDNKDAIKEIDGLGTAAEEAAKNLKTLEFIGGLGLENPFPIEEAKEFFDFSVEGAKKLGLFVDKASKDFKPLENSLDKLNKEFKEMEPLLKADVKLFGSNAFVFHRGALEALIERYETLGIVLPESLKLAKEFFDALDEAAKDFETIEQAMQIFFDKQDEAIKEAVGGFDVIAESLDDGAGNFEDFGEEGQKAFEGMVSPGLKLQDILTGLGLGLGILTDFARDFISEDLAGAFDDLADGADDLMGAFASMAAGDPLGFITGGLAGIKSFIDGIDSLTKSWWDLNQAVVITDENIDAFLESMANAAFLGGVDFSDPMFGGLVSAIGKFKEDVEDDPIEIPIVITKKDIRNQLDDMNQQVIDFFASQGTIDIRTQFVGADGESDPLSVFEDQLNAAKERLARKQDFLAIGTSDKKTEEENAQIREANQAKFEAIQQGINKAFEDGVLSQQEILNLTKGMTVAERELFIELAKEKQERQDILDQQTEQAERAKRFEELQRRANKILKDGKVTFKELAKLTADLTEEERNVLLQLIEQQRADTARKREKREIKHFKKTQEALTDQLELFGLEKLAIDSLITGQELWTNEIRASVLAAQELMATLSGNATGTGAGGGSSTPVRQPIQGNDQNVNISGTQTFIVNLDGETIAKVSQPYLEENTQGNFTRQRRETIRRQGGIK